MLSSMSQAENMDQRPDGLPLITHTIPNYGAYVVFTLDAVATLEALEDQEATAQARALPTRKYIGCVARVLGLPNPERRYHQCNCFFLSQGLPLADSTNFINKTMCVAISPATHPAGREAMSPSPPLPWDNLYHHSLHAKTLRLVNHKEIDHRLSPSLTLEQIILTGSLISEDVLRRQDLEFPDLPPLSCHSSSSLASSTHPSFISLRQSQSIPSASNSPIAAQTNTEVPAADDDAYSMSSLSSSNTGASGSVTSLDLMVGHAAFSVEEEPRYRFTPVVDYTTDLSTVNEFSDAKHFFEEIRAVERIRAESEKRSQELVEKLEKTRLNDSLVRKDVGVETVLPTHVSSSPWRISFVSRCARKFGKCVQRKLAHLRVGAHRSGETNRGS